jgi:hypothetical protein
LASSASCSDSEPRALWDAGPVGPFVDTAVDFVNRCLFVAGSGATELEGAFAAEVPDAWPEWTAICCFKRL